MSRFSRCKKILRLFFLFLAAVLLAGAATGCVATRKMSSNLPLTNKEKLEETERLPYTLGIVFDEEYDNPCVSLRDGLIAGKVYTEQWTKDKLLILGKNYFKEVVLLDRFTRGKTDFLCRISEEYKYRYIWNGFSFTASTGLKLYDANGIFLYRCEAESSGDFGYSSALLARDFAMGFTLGLLIPVFLPMDCREVCESADATLSKALSASYSTVFEKTYDYILSSSVKSMRTVEVSGTGFAVSPEYILTAFHVVENMKNIEVLFPDGEWRKAEIAENIANLDVALLKVKKRVDDWIPLSSSPVVNAGDRVFSLGFPVGDLLGDEVKYSEGVVNSLSGLHGDKSQYQVSIPIQPGNSGGPVVTEEGEVIGLVTSTAAANYFYNRTGDLPQNINWATKLTSIRQLLGSNYEFKPGEMPEGREALIAKVRNATCRVRAVERD